MTRFMKTIIVSAAVLTITAIGIDLYTWAQVASGSDADLTYWIKWSGYLRFARTGLFSLIFIAYLQSAAFTKDHILMQCAMVAATIADYYLILENKLITGIGIFAMMQLVLLYRHLQGFGWQLFHERKYVYLTAGLFVFAIAVLFFLYAPLQEKHLFWPVAAYGFLLILSVLAAAYSFALKRLSEQQSALALAGMICFLLCDITVGLGAIWQNQPSGYLVRALTGLVYTPALILLSLSAIGKNR